MPELQFEIVGAREVEHAASPQLALDLQLNCSPMAQPIDSVLLRCAVRIEAGARVPEPEEQARVRELFGPPSAWARASRSLLWVQTSLVVPAFARTTRAEVQLPCSYDLAAAASKYLRGVRDGYVPITVQFSGAVFYRAGDRLQTEPISWDREARFALPVGLFHAVIDRHFPNAGVLALRRDVYERLDHYRIEHGLSSWERAVERLLESQGAEGAR